MECTKYGMRTFRQYCESFEQEWKIPVAWRGPYDSKENNLIGYLGVLPNDIGEALKKYLQLKNGELNDVITDKFFGNKAKVFIQYNDKYNTWQAYLFYHDNLSKPPPYLDFNLLNPVYDDERDWGPKDTIPEDDYA